jgi:cysteine desulfurase
VSEHRFNLDFNAGAPVDVRVRDGMAALPSAADANPNSPHARGRAARDLLEAARERIAVAIGTEPDEVVFTSGGTESNNMAVATGLGVALATGRPAWSSRIEHPSVAVPFAAGETTWTRHLALTRAGEVVVPNEDQPRAFVTAVLAHHELAVVQDLAPLAAWAHAAEALLHSDLSQALGRVALEPLLPLLDYATLSPHKAGGPKGIGVLIAKRGRPCAPVLRGGAQELGRRPGTQCVRLAHGAAVAIELAEREQADRAERMQRSLDAVLERVTRTQGRVVCDRAARLLPNTRTVSLAPLAARHALPALDLAGILVSFGSACTSGAREVSASLLALGFDDEEARSCVRISVAHDLEIETAQDAGNVFCQALVHLSRKTR